MTGRKLHHDCRWNKAHILLEIITSPVKNNLYQMITLTWVLMILRILGMGLWPTCSLMKKRQLPVITAYRESVHFKVIFLFFFFSFCSFYNFANLHTHTHTPRIVLWFENWQLINPIIVLQGRTAHAEEETNLFKVVATSWLRASLIPVWRKEILRAHCRKGKIFEICSVESSMEP